MIYKKTLPWKNLLDIPQGLIDSDKDGVFENLKLPWEGVQNKPSAYRPYDAIYIPKNPIAYFKDSLVDVLRGIKPEGYDESTKTDYGLRTATDADGNLLLVVTERMDDTPFPGVKSFAVEEGTENLQASEYTLNHTSEVTIEQIDDGKLGHYKVSVPAGTYDYNPKVWFTPNASLTAGKTYTSSLYVRWIKGYTSSAYVWLNSATGGGNGADSTTKKKPRDGRAYTVFSGLAVDGEFGVSLIFPKTLTEDLIVEIWEPQLEQKPFATSFVDGSRTTGRFYIPLENLGFDPANDDWVIAYWKKPTGTNSGWSGFNIFAIGKYSSDYSEGYIWVGKDANYDRLALHVVHDDELTHVTNDADYPADYLTAWHFEVLRKTDGVVDYFLDCKKVLSVAYTTMPAFKDGIWVGRWAGGISNMLVANLLMSKATDENGNLIWTDDYIRQVYELQRPFII